MQSRTRAGQGHCLVVSSLSAAISLLAADQGTTVSMTVVCFISVFQVREAKRRAVGAASLFVVSASASSAFGMENRARTSFEYHVGILLVPKDLVHLFVDLKDGLVASFASGAGPQFLDHGQDIFPGLERLTTGMKGPWCLVVSHVGGFEIGELFLKHWKIFYLRQIVDKEVHVWKIDKVVSSLLSGLQNDLHPKTFREFYRLISNKYIQVS